MAGALLAGEPQPDHLIERCGRALAFREQLQGRVSFVEMINPARGKRLRAIFEKIPT